MRLCVSLRFVRLAGGLTPRAPDLKRARQTLTVNPIPPFQAGNANRWAVPCTKIVDYSNH